MFQTYEEAISWVTKLMPKHGIRPGLERMSALMKRLGHPERRLKFIHVAGTNGKGSTCVFIASIIRGAGYDVGLFTSPYLEKYSSRIQWNDESIPDETLLSLVNRIKPIADELEPEHGPLSMFEITTALAILYFATVSYPDFVVLETGLGGRLDSTNVVVPLISVITNIGIDHTDVLGDTIAEIAREKAGIIKTGVPVVSAALHPEAAQVIRETAAAKKSTLYELGRQYHFESKEVREDRQTFDFESPFRKMPNVRIAMNGTHQQTNAAVALMAVEVLRQYYALVLDEEELYASLERVSWKGRLEMVSRAPRILLDGAHNADGAAALADALQQIYSYEKLVFVLGMVRNKNHQEYLRHILPIVDTLIVTEPDFFKKMPSEELAAAASAWIRTENAQVALLEVPEWKKAIERAKEEAGPNDLIVVSGSLYFLSDARSWILKQTDSEKGW